MQLILDTNVLILRGLPGSGKTTLATQICKKSCARVFSTDFFWDYFGEYKFDPSRIGEAHAWCFKEYLGALNINWINDAPLIVDNTNISAYEIAPYVLAAQAFKKTVKVVTLWVPPIPAFHRGIHQVPLKVIMGMHNRMVNEPLPPFWREEALAIETRQDVEIVFPAREETKPDTKPIEEVKELGSNYAE